MKILLLGEYSRLHNSLKEGLTNLGHKVTIVGDGDGFKNFSVDYSTRAKLLESPIISKFKNAIFTFFKIDLTKTEKGVRFLLLLPKLKNYDVVQFINERPIKTTINFELFLLKKIIENNKKAILLSCGADTFTAKHMIKQTDNYNIMTPYFKDKSLKPHFQYIFNYLKPKQQKLHHFIVNKVDSIIASDIDYVEPLKHHSKFYGVIPNPINSDLFNFDISFNYPLTILLGINRGNYHAKGINYFEEALVIVKKNVSKEKIKIVVSENLPYNTYKKLSQDTHILLDQVYSKDQGFNALEAMAKGQIVFTGAETSFLKHYNLKKDSVCINALPNAEYIAKKLIFLIKNLDEMRQISNNAKSFIKKHHDHNQIAEKYLAVYREGL